MRPTLDRTMLAIARLLADRATCSKLAVGCVITDDLGRIIGTGYNGPPHGMTHCTDIPCAGASAPRGADLCEAVHAEQNALLYCDVLRARTIYITHAPCMRCTKTLLNTPINRVVFLDGTNIEQGAKLLWQTANRRWDYHAGNILAYAVESKT